MSHELESATRTMIAERNRLSSDLATSEERVAGLQKDLAFAQGRIRELETSNRTFMSERDFYLRWAVALTKQILNVGAFVKDALASCREAVGQAPATLNTIELFERLEADIGRTLPDSRDATIPGRDTNGKLPSAPQLSIATPPPTDLDKLEAEVTTIIKGPNSPRRIVATEGNNG